MNFVADESIDHQIVVRLRQEGHQVLAVAEMQPGISDEDVLKLANDNQSLLLTADKDFGDLIFRLKKVVNGVILIRLSGLKSASKGQLVSLAIQEHGQQFVGAFTVIIPGGIRIRPNAL